MDKIVRGIFLSQRGDKDKSVLIKTLKPHLLTIDASIAESIASFCVPELSNDKKLTRLLSATVLEILSQVSCVESLLYLDCILCTAKPSLIERLNNGLNANIIPAESPVRVTE